MPNPHPAAVALVSRLPYGFGLLRFVFGECQELRADVWLQGRREGGVSDVVNLA